MLFGYQIAAVCVSKLYEDVLREFVEAFNAALTAQNWRVCIYTTGSDLYFKSRSNLGEETIFDLISPDYVDAMVIFEDRILDADLTERLCSYAHEHEIPAIMLGSTRQGVCSISFDFIKGFEEVVRHLVTCHGIRDFHFIAGIKGNAFSEEREDVMHRVLAEYGIPFDDSHISYGDFWSVPARAAVEKLIAENRLPEAIVCANDTMAIAVCTALLQHGYRIPRDIIVTGFDGVDAIRYSVPKVTSCECNYTELGTVAAGLVMKAGRGETLPESVSLVPRMILSESCGCRPENLIDTVDFINNLTDSFNRFRNEDDKLHEISAVIQSCTSIEDVAQVMTHHIFYGMIALLKEECIDASLNPQEIHSLSTFGEQLYVLVDTDIPDGADQPFIPAQQLLPRPERLFAQGVPLIFIALHSSEIPLGYLCFHYADTGMQNYLKINQTAMSLSAAVSGYRNVRYQQHLREVVEDIYKFDALTGLYNRKAFLHCYRQLREAGKLPHPTLVLCDLDGLKYINDHFSHAEGDNAISVTADALRSACPGGLCCRYGGDEMVAILPDCDPEEIRRRILTHLVEYNLHSGKPYTVSASIGIVDSADGDFENMFLRADALMYEDKRGKPLRRK